MNFLAKNGENFRIFPTFSYFLKILMPDLNWDVVQTRMIRSDTELDTSFSVRSDKCHFNVSDKWQSTGKAQRGALEVDSC